jgi:hypothetical protein
MAFIEGSDYVPEGGLLVALGAATVEQTGMLPGHTYEFVASAPALARWGADDASIADGGFDFTLPANTPVRSICPAGDTAINIIEANADSSANATVTIARVKA